MATKVSIEERDGALALPEQLGGGRLLMRDIRVAGLLVGDGRDRAMARLFGVPSDQAGLLTLIVALMLAQAIHDKAQRLMRAGGAPSATDGLLSVAFAANPPSGTA